MHKNMSKNLTLTLLAGLLAGSSMLMAAEPGPGATPSGVAANPPKVVHDWPEYRGPNGQFGDTTKVALADSMTAMTPLWDSEEKGIGFGKSLSSYNVSYGGDLGPSGISSPIVAGGLVIMSYFTPSGDVIDESFKARINKPEVWEKYKWKAKVAADDVVIGIDAATGKTRWKQVFAGAGRNGSSGKRGLWGCTPIAHQGKVYALGSCGAIYCLDLATGKPVWQTPNEPVLEAAKKEALALKTFGHGNSKAWVGIPTGWLMVQDDVLIVPVKTHYNISLGRTRGVSLADGKTLWELPGHPGLFAYATIEGRKCLVNAGICIEAKTGKVLWQQKAEQTYNGPPVMVGNVLIGYVPHPKSDPPGIMGLLAGFQLDLTGAKKIWTLDERFHREIVYDAGGFRCFAERDGLLYNVTPSSDTPGKKGTGVNVVQIIRPTDGTILASQPADGLSLPFLWGDRLVLAGDISHRPRAANAEYWQLFTTDPAAFKVLGQRWLATDKHQGTGGYELQVYDPFADGLVFMRVFGGIRCYDLRAKQQK